MDVTLACEDANSKLVDVVTVADVDDEDRVGKSLLQIWKLRFGHTRPSVNYAKDWLDHSFPFLGLVWSEKEFYFGCDH